MRRAGQAVAVIALTAATLVVVNPGSANAASSLRAPVASYTIGDPGVLHDGSQWVNFYTGYRGKVSVAPNVNGPWKQLTHSALNADPKWATQTDTKHKPSYWAPAAIKVANKKYLIVFAGPRKDSTYLRCIGIGFATKAAGPYTPAKKPLACVGGKFGAADVRKNVTPTNSVIDPTPRFLTVNGVRGLYVTYKTQRKVDGHYFSTIRMVQVNTASTAAKVQIVGKSHHLTTRPTNIEENPVMVQRGKTFTLFTSLGGYTLCSYHTEYRTSTNPWKWSNTSHRLSFPSGTKTCGQGDADVYYSSAAKTWRIFWSGRYPAQGHPFHLYVGALTFSGNTPKVGKVYKRRTS
jgi:arabinan endo-1,5-alpha-L-arabinosidase